MLRPREGRDLRLLSYEVSIAPQAQLSWATDVFGNVVATAVFNEMADVLTVDSVALVDLTAAAWPVFAIAGSAVTFPFRYVRCIRINGRGGAGRNVCMNFAAGPRNDRNDRA